MIARLGQRHVQARIWWFCCGVSFSAAVLSWGNPGGWQVAAAAVGCFVATLLGERHHRGRP
jgi:hypothetical protein